MSDIITVNLSSYPETFTVNVSAAPQSFTVNIQEAHDGNDGTSPQLQAGLSGLEVSNDEGNSWEELISYEDFLISAGYESSPVSNRTRCVVVVGDCFSATGTICIPGMSLVSMGGGTAVISPTTSANHPGVIIIRDSTTLNSGVRIMPDVTAVLIGGGEQITCVFQQNTSRTTAVSRIGFFDNTSVIVSPQDGAWLEMIGNGANATLTGRTRVGGTVGTTATSYAVSLDTWYSGEIIINSDATLVTFKLFAENGTLLWLETLSSFIPTTANHETSFGVFAYETTADAQGNLFSLDYFKFEIDRTLVR